MEADVHAKHAFTNYVDLTKMTTWQPNLKAIESVKGTLFQKGSEGYLVYTQNNQEMRMHVHVDQCNDQVFDAVYDVPGVWNRTTEYFIEKGDKLLWKSVVEFRFDADSAAPKGVFEVATKKSMEQFLSYMKKQG